MLNVLWIALGVAALLVAVALCSVLLRLHRTLGMMERTLETADEAIREVAPEMRGSLGNVNDIAAGVNLALRSAGTGAGRLSGEVSTVAQSASLTAAAAAHGARVGWGAFWREIGARAG
ncbi:MAG: hypothetical protein ACREOV_03750 [Candidatus Dormibacteraceae bacterium]